ncbi:MAG: hypothetical protein LBR74_00870 [Eubacterium sp.]|nr:hypothetical protein [Eubacterium sp.]
MLAEAETLEILVAHNDLGIAYDFWMFKESLVGILPTEIILILDSGYQGAHEFLPNAIIPFKTFKNHELTPEEKAHNTALAKQIGAIEHINRELKIFRICKETYDNL